VEVIEMDRGEMKGRFDLRAANEEKAMANHS
jgi:hypothetical protein